MLALDLAVLAIFAIYIIHKIYNEETYYYFAYGSNMSRKRIEDRVGKVKDLGVAHIEDYVLTADVLESKGRWGYANCKKEEGKVLYGVVYKLTLKQIRLLDFYEGSPIFYTRRLLKDNKGRFVDIYIDTSSRVQPKDAPLEVNYKNYLLKGATEHKFPLVAIVEIEKFATVENKEYKG